MGPTHPHFRFRQIEDVSTQQFTELDSFSFLFTSNEGCVCLLTFFFRTAVTLHFKEARAVGTTRLHQTAGKRMGLQTNKLTRAAACPAKTKDIRAQSQQSTKRIQLLTRSKDTNAQQQAIAQLRRLKAPNSEALNMKILDSMKIWVVARFSRDGDVAIHTLTVKETQLISFVSLHFHHLSPSLKLE